MRCTALVSGLVLGSVAAALSATGCGLMPRTCTLKGYSNGLLVRVVVPANPDAYRVEYEAEGEAFSLSFQVAGGDRGPECIGDCVFEGKRLHGTGDAIGGMLLASVQRVGQDIGPSQIAVRVYRGDALVAQDSFQPQYRTDEPNGEGCGERVSASAELTVR